MVVVVEAVVETGVGAGPVTGLGPVVVVLIPVVETAAVVVV